MAEPAPQAVLHEWRGVSADGAKKSGVRRGGSLGELHAWLAEQKITPYKTKTRAQRALTTQETSYLFEQLATLLNAGLPILDALTVLAQSAPTAGRSRPASPYEEIRDDIESGLALSAGLERRLPPSERMATHLLRLGEAGGRLKEVLDRLNARRKRDAQMRKAFIRAATYPLIVTLSAAGALVVMMTHIVPAFQTLYSQNGAALPAHTELTIMLSDYVRAYGLHAAAALAATAAALVCAVKSDERARRLLSRGLTAAPLIGALRRAYFTRRFVGLLELTYRSGMPINDSIRRMEALFPDAMCLEALRRIDAQIRQGVHLHAAVAAAGFFPELVPHMLRIGETGGNINEILQKLERHYDERLEEAVSRATQLIEPCLILFVAAIVGWIVVSMYAPVFHLGSAL